MGHDWLNDPKLLAFIEELESSTGVTFNVQERAIPARGRPVKGTL